MKNLIVFLFIGITAIGTSGCSVSKRLAPFTETLAAAANSNQSAEQKLEILAVTTTRALSESLVFANPKKTVQFVSAFTRKNEQSILKIVNDINGNVSTMSLTEKVGFYANTAQKPYIRELKSEVKTVEKRVGRKIKTFGVLGNFMNVLNPLKK